MEQDKIEENYRLEKKKLQTKWILITIFVAIFAAVIASEFTLIYYGQSKLNKSEVAQNSEENIDAISETLKNFRTVIDELYIGEIDEQKIMDETIRGYVNGLDDEYSEYMTAKEWEDYMANALGNYVGIGIYMHVNKEGNIEVLEPIKDSPAEAAGLKSGDIIVYVNDESMIGIDSEIVSSKIKGEEGTKVKITVLRDTEYLDFEIERKSIKVYHVETEMLENKIGYMSLMTFDEGCAEEFESAYNDLKAKGAENIIIDLRNNTGGLVVECLEIADLILPKGATELVTVDSKGNKEYSKSKKDPIVEGKIVVLINEYSASASEILVAALKENNKAEVVGKTSYGKGVIQSVLELNDGSVLKLTVSEYFTPKENKINKIGIEPDYDIELDVENEIDTQLNKAIELLK